jgi:hypothetical protein
MVTEYQVSGVGVAPLTPSGNGRKLFLDLEEGGLPADLVEGVGEVQLDHSFALVAFVVLSPVTARMHRSVDAQAASHADLSGGKERSSLFFYVGAKTLPNNAAKYFSDGNGPDASLRLCQSHESSTGKVGGDFGWR